MDSTFGPEYVISLQITDEIIKERNMNLAENVVAGTKYAEDVLIKRLEEFRSQNKDENTVLNYFDEHEVHPLEIDIGSLLTASNPAESTPTTLDGALDKVLEIIRAKVGDPRNYGPTFEQLAERKRQRDDALVCSLTYPRYWKPQSPKKNVRKRKRKSLNGTTSQ